MTFVMAASQVFSFCAAFGGVDSTINNMDVSMDGSMDVSMDVERRRPERITEVVAKDCQKSGSRFP